MAIEYHVYTDLELEDLKARLTKAAARAGDMWEGWWVKDDLGPFHEEIMEEYGVTEGFRSKLMTRHFKDLSVEARAYLLEFYDSLPGRKLILNGDSFVDFQPG